MRSVWSKAYQTKSTFRQDQYIVQVCLSSLTPYNNTISYVGLNQRPMYAQVSVGTKCLNLEIIPRDLLIFEEINSICCFQVRFESIRTPRYLTQSFLSRRIKEFLSWSKSDERVVNLQTDNQFASNVHHCFSVFLLDKIIRNKLKRHSVLVTAKLRLTWFHIAIKCLHVEVNYSSDFVVQPFCLSFCRLWYLEMACTFYTVQTQRNENKSQTVKLQHSRRQAKISLSRTYDEQILNQVPAVRTGGKKRWLIIVSRFPELSNQQNTQRFYCGQDFRPCSLAQLAPERKALTTVCLQWLRLM